VLRYDIGRGPTVQALEKAILRRGGDPISVPSWEQGEVAKVAGGGLKHELGADCGEVGEEGENY
jgi:hypothetical protein